MSMNLQDTQLYEAPFYLSVSHWKSFHSVRCHEHEGNFGKRKDFFTFTLMYPCSDRQTKIIYLARKDSYGRFDCVIKYQ